MKPPYLFICEGKTEVEYIQGPLQNMLDSTKTKIVLTAKHNGTDIQVDKLWNVAKKNVARKPSYKAIFVLFDRDNEHEKYKRFCEKIENKIQAIPSNPCFEVWLLWHVCAHGQTENFAELLKKHLKAEYDKLLKSFKQHFITANFEAAFTQACERARNQKNRLEAPYSAMPHVHDAIVGKSLS